MTAWTAPALAGTLRYEALASVRRPTLWFAVVPLSLAALAVAWRSPSDIGDGTSHVGGAALVAGLLCSPAIGAALADRLARGRRPGMDDLVAAAPCGAAVRVPAVVAAPLAVALLPPFLVVLVCAVPAAVADGGPRPLAVAPAAFAAVAVPGAAVLTALACLLGLVLPLSLARVCAAGAWMWSTIASPDLSPLPTPTGTLLSPVGGYPAAAWFGERAVWADRGLAGPLSPAPGTGSALLNLAVVAALTALLLTLAGLAATRRG
ncbi:hypothetical protein O4J56_28005 [Nocardiopsis sp. RSe5-2]|uniref:ABC transporter permease n=1 Tax=Nocardiopsis endophytica TaxID=3018445 RepID=A0ABT4UCP2_9ACTN|nr:hypothetical protein [Nocardiopsis endophytica]MDA2814521.1 hypothetical protein [Nocardiopsis endophytica]